MRIPDFFIIGAPKCGTTALYTYLREHPRVFMPDIKEPHYFCRDLNFPPRSAVRNRDAYLELFAGAPEDALIGEASASYLYSEIAIPGILRANPNAKFVAILRNPVDMAYSFHSTLLNNLNEDVKDFCTAWRLQESRKELQNIPRYCTEPKFLQYKAVCSVSEQITRLMKHARSENVFIIIFDDFARDPKNVYTHLLKFLNLPSFQEIGFRRVNANKVYRIEFLNRFLRRPPFPFDHLYLPMKRICNSVGWRPRRSLEWLNTTQQCRPTLEHEVRAVLEAEFAEDIAKLEDVLGRDLGAWRGQAGKKTA